MARKDNNYVGYIFLFSQLYRGDTLNYLIPDCNTPLLKKGE